MAAELWRILPHERRPYTRRVRLELGQRIYFGDILLVLLRDRDADGTPGPVCMVWEIRGTHAPERTPLQPVNLGPYGDWVPVAECSDGTVLFYVDAPAWPAEAAA
jgi:hypothetical protein